MRSRFFSTAQRAPHLGPYPFERLARRATAPDLLSVPQTPPLSFRRPQAPASIVNAMADYQAMLDAIRDGVVNPVVSDIPGDPTQRAQHLKAFAYFCDAAAVGVCGLPDAARLGTPRANPDVGALAQALRTRQTKTLAAGIDLIMADLRDSMEAPPVSIDGHSHALVLLYENPRAPHKGEPGTAWIEDALAHRACLRASETAAVLANYLRVLGFEARAHTQTCADVDLNRLAVAAGLATVEEGRLDAPYIGARFGLAVVTTTCALAADQPLVAKADQPAAAFGLSWRLGRGTQKSAATALPYADRNFKDGAYPFENLKRVADPTTYIDAARIPRVPKRSDLFARAQFGDMGPKLQQAAKGGYYVRKAAPSAAQRRALGAFVLLQDGPVASEKVPLPPEAAADLIKATSYFLGADAVGLSPCPDWVWYSHDAAGDPITPTHTDAISMVIDQGFETMEGSSGDDWIAVAQSMRAYLRFSLLGGVIAAQIRALGYAAKAHTVMDGEVLQPPLLLLSGLGEVSRIGEVILNPYLGPRLKSGVITTTLPLAHDKPIDFGLQAFCEACNKCARECPSGAITAGPKKMFNGYEIWKSDSQKCATYRVTTPGGAMCGRCMKTCPWNLEGLFQDAAVRWMARRVPSAAPVLARLDDMLGRGGLNPVKKWWWDLELRADGGYGPPAAPVNARGLSPGLKVRAEDQTMAVYPASLAPHPYPYPDAMSREAGIAAFAGLPSVAAYKTAIATGRDAEVVETYTAAGDSPVLAVRIAKVDRMTPAITKYEFETLDGAPLPAWDAGAHLDVVVAPEFLRQYSMSGDPSDRTRYQIGVLNEPQGRGGSALLHRIFTEGRRVFISRPINHFPVDLEASHTLLMGGGIGVTPLLAMAHALHRAGRCFSLHYSGRQRADMGFLQDIATAPWHRNVHLHVTREGSRADLDGILGGAREAQVYVCGSAPYMEAVKAAATRAGLPQTALHLEYFAVPEGPARENHPFKLHLARANRTLDVAADQTATEVLQDNGIAIDVKCGDGLCGVCKTRVLSGEVDHRDVVLSQAQRETHAILCQSRAREADGTLTLDL